MPPLRQADADRLLEFVGDAHAAEALEPLTTELLDRLAGVMDAGFATYYEYDLVRAAVPTYVPCSTEAEYSPPPGGAWEGVWLSPDFWGRCDFGAWGERLDRAARLRYETASFAEHFGVVDCAWMLFWLSASQRAGVLVHTQERDIDERDRQRLAALRPHLGALIRNSRARRQLAALTTALDGAEEREPRGFLLLDARTGIEHASPGARRLLDRWFGRFEDQLPRLVADWLRSSGSEPLRVERSHRRLVVEAPAAGALVLREEHVAAAALTRREVEVLRRLAAGASTSQIASELCVTPATVSKHLEHVYRKLGVTSRTGALAAIGATASRGNADH